MKQYLLIQICLALAFMVDASDIPLGLYDGQSRVEISLQSFVQGIEPGSVVVLSEYHEVASTHESQLKLLKALRSHQPNPVILGLEHVSFDQQNSLEKYLAGHMSETQFRAAVGFGERLFDFYKPILELAAGFSEVRAMNAPRSLTSKIAREGLESLTSEERAYLPQGFRFSESEYLTHYYDRFRAAMTHAHPMPEAYLRNYFAAFHVWDDMMAYQAELALSRKPDAIVVIFMGALHVSYGGGLPERLRRRGLEVSTIYQNSLSIDEHLFEDPDYPEWGLKAPTLWVVE